MEFFKPQAILFWYIKYAPHLLTMKKVHFITFGCQTNIYDSRRMGDILSFEGYEINSFMEDSDIIILNTCSIREKAKEKIFSELGKIKKLKQQKISSGKYLVVVIAGCVAMTEEANIFKRMPIVDIVMGTESYHRIASLINEIYESHIQDESRKLLVTDFETVEKFNSLPKTRTSCDISDTVVIQEGCDKFCSYCVVPHTRGREYSRPLENVVNEVKYLVDHGTREITLLGQNVDNYNYENKKLSDLLRILNNINDLRRIRYLSSYPSQFDDSLIQVHKDLEKLMPLIYIPAQSGSNHVLKLMNRKYTREQYLELVDRIRKNVKNAAFSSDFIVGFADETDEDFEETLDLVRRVGYATSFSFKYSPRPHTVGIGMPNQVPEPVKMDRLNRLQELLNSQQIEFNRRAIGTNAEVLLENYSTSNSNKSNTNNIFFGRTPHGQAVIVEVSDQLATKLKPGDVVNTKIVNANLRTLWGRVE